MKVWITKYALEQGRIIEGEMIEKANIVDDYTKEKEIGYIATSEIGVLILKENEFTFSKESAIAQVLEMRQKKIESLRKQIKKLEKMKFE